MAVHGASGSGARATATALLLLSFNIVGLGGGPLAVGMLSDMLGKAEVADPLRFALMALAPVGLVGALTYFAVSRVIAADTDWMQPVGSTSIVTADECWMTARNRATSSAATSNG